MATIKVEELKQQLRKSGFGYEFHPDLETHINNGTPKFELVKTEDRDGMQYSCAASLAAGKTPGVYFYNGFMARVDIPIQVAHPAGLLGPFTFNPVESDISPETYYINTRVFEYVLANATGKNNLFPGLPPTPVDTIAKGDISVQLQLLMRHEPDLFNQFVVKYQPALDFEVPKKIADKQQALYDRHHPFQFFKPEYGVDINTAFTMVAHDVWIHRTLTHREKQEEYGTWLKINFNKITPNGNHEFDRWHDAVPYVPEQVLERFAMQEYTTDDPVYNRKQIRSIGLQIRNGELPALTPVADPDNRLLFGANPPYNTMILYNHEMKPQRHEKFKVAAANKAKEQPDTNAVAPDTPTTTKAVTGNESNAPNHEQGDDKKKVNSRPRRRQPVDVRNKKSKGPSPG